MKVLFIEARKKFKNINLASLNALPRKIHIIYTIQYKELAEKIREELARRNFKVLGFEQVLGCSRIKPKADLLLIGSGKFHASQIAFSTKKEVFIYEENILRKITEEEIKTREKSIKAKLSKFYSSKNIGIFASLKQGQKSDLIKIKSLMQKKFPEKKFYLFIADNFNSAEAENFPIDIWINTACPGIEQDSEKILNYERILKKNYF